MTELTEENYDEFYAETSEIVDEIVESEVAKFLASLDKKLSRATGMPASDAWEWANGCVRDLDNADTVTKICRWVSSINGGWC